MIDDGEPRGERDERESDERRHDHQHGRHVEEDAIGGAWGDVFLDDELGDVGQRLEPAVGKADLVRPDAVLHPGGDLALQPRHVGDDGHRDPEHHRRADERHHRSTSPKTGSSEPKVATTSARRPPGRMCATVWRFLNDGALIFKRWGNAVPFETM